MGKTSRFSREKERLDKVKHLDELNLLDKKGNYSDRMNLDNNANQVNNLNEVLEDENLFDDFSDLLDVSRYKRTVNAASKKLAEACN